MVTTSEPARDFCCYVNNISSPAWKNQLVDANRTVTELTAKCPGDVEKRGPIPARISRSGASKWLCSPVQVGLRLGLCQIQTYQVLQEHLAPSTSTAASGLGDQRKPAEDRGAPSPDPLLPQFPNVFVRSLKRSPSVIHVPTGDVIGSRGVLVQHVSVAHVPGDVHGDAVQVDVLPGSVPEVRAADGSSPAGQLPPEVPGVQVARRLAAGRPAAVAVPHGGGVARLQTGAGVAQSPR
ncbi:hypothetical protein EYF80_030839 [Liparis tanakae]|uniref:Uncharacterized protein n=1 Tax=Liparis tanakae TaxID=230148 RepID=A0A4Z2GZH4_9TELE|nr:hypothetical protein EYF80_030839 [Liparis tanakae]